MAFMMPLVKQNYSLYNTPGSGSAAAGNGAVPTTAARRIRKNSDQTDRRTAAAAVNKVVLRRNAKSESASLSTSPGYHALAATTGSGGTSSKPVEIRRGGRLSIPAFLSPQSSVRRSSGKQRQANSVPNGTKSPAGKPTFSPSSRSSLSSESSTDSFKANSGNFHSRLINRLKKTLGIGHKEARPTSS